MRPLHLLAVLAPALAGLPACDAGAETGGGLVVLNDDPVDPRRPHFFDLGELEHGTRTELPVLLENRDPVPVTIEHVDPACQCTSVKRLRLVDEEGRVLREGDVERDGRMLTVPSGGRTELLLGVNTLSVRPNRDRLAILRVVSDSVTTPFLTLEVHLRSHKPFSVTPRSLQLGAIPQSHGGSKQVRILTGVPDSGARVAGVRETTGGVEATLDHHVDGAEPVWVLTARVPPLKPKGGLREKVVLDTVEADGEEGTLEVDVWAQVVDDVGFDRPTPFFPPVREGETSTLELDLVARVPGMRVRLEDVRVSGPAAEHVSATFRPAEGYYVDDDRRCERWTLELEAGPGLPPGRFEAELVALLDDDQWPEVRTTLAGHVGE